jgi:hypothetical protein
MVIYLKIKDQQIEVSLKKNKQIKEKLDQISWQDQQSLSENLLSKVDQLLKRNNFFH